MAKSPSIILREADNSSYTVTTSTTILAIVGYATKGPIGKAVLTTSRKEFIDTYGPVPLTAPWSSLAAYRAFNQGNQVLFYRVAETTGANQAVGAEYCIRNSSAATAGYQELTQLTPIAFGSYTAKEVYDFRLRVDGGTIRDVYIGSPTTGDWVLSDIATQINTQITGATQGFQEWDKATGPTISTATEYRFKLTVNGTAVAGGKDLSVDLIPGDALSDISTKIAASIAAGSRGYQRWKSATNKTSGSTTGLTNGNSYYFKVAKDGGAATEYTIVATSGMTYGQLVAAMQAAVLSAGLTVLFDADGSPVSGRIRVQSNTNGATSAIALTAGTTGDDLWGTLDVGGSNDTAVAGSAGMVATSNYSVAVNSYTGRIRITSASATPGVTSIILIAATSIGGSLATLLTGINAGNAGEAAVGATCAVNGTTGRIRITSSTTGVLSSIAITEGTGADNAHLVALAGTQTAVAGAGAILPATMDNILFKAKEKGTATNNIYVVKSTRVNPVTLANVYKVEIYYNGVLKETFDEVSLNIADANFFATMINADVANGGSAWVEIEYADRVPSGVLTFPDGTYYLGTGTDEYVDGDGIGDYDYRVGTDGIPNSGGATLFVNALSTSGDLGNAEIFDYHILVTPDNDSEATQNAAIQLAETEARQDFIYVADPPFGLTYTEVVDWHNGAGSHGRNTAINSSYACTYWPWLKDINPDTGEYVWCPPSVFIGEKYLEVDRRFAPWFAPAGDRRGKLIAYDYETTPSQAQRDVLYGDFNAVNPIVNFVTKGLEIYGEKTLLRENSALNRIHVRRMVIYIKKLIKKAMESIVFEPHNADSWTRATTMINSILEPVRQGGGLDAYKVVIDSTTNTPDVIAQSIMKGVIELVPVGVIEIVDLTIKIDAVGTTITG
jgi:hypothetical protein